MLQLTHSAARWLRVCPASGAVSAGLADATARILKRRYYLVERARQASIVGILVGPVPRTALHACRMGP